MKKVDLTFRKMKTEDQLSIPAAFPFPWTTPQELAEKWQRYFKEQEQGLRTVYLIVRGEKPIAYGSLLRNSKYSSFKENRIPEINDVWVAQEERGAGLGTKLVQFIEHQATTEGYAQIGLGVGLYRAYGSGQRIYYKLGYIPDGRGITYNYEPVDPNNSYQADDELILWLTKPLSPSENQKEYNFHLVKATIEDHPVIKNGSFPGTDWNMGEFFILSKFQKSGLGRRVACKIFDQFPGVWEVAAMPANEAALKFWGKVLPEYCTKECLPVHHIVNDKDHPKPYPMWIFRFVSRSCLNQRSSPPHS